MAGVLFISPHNDDIELFSCFNLLRYRDQAHVIVALRSFRMGEKSYPHREFRMTYQEREEETAAAMEILGCSWEQWTIPDKEPDPSGYLLTALARLEEREWDQVFAPAVEEDGQYQHSLVGTLVDEVFGERVTHYLTYTKGGRSRDGEEVPFEPDWPALKLQALACYRTQIRHPSTRSHFIDGGLREYVVAK